MISSVHPIVVECCGIPGAGKTSVAALVAARLKDAGVSVEERPTVARDCLRASVGPSRVHTGLRVAARLIHRPRLAFAALTYLTHAKNRTAVLLRVVRMSHLARLDSMAVSRPARVVLLDEWLVHELMLATIEDETADERYPSQLARQCVAEWRPDILVHCVAAPATAAARVNVRASGSSLDGTPAEVLTRHFELASRHLSHAILPAFGCDRLVAVSTESAADVAAAANRLYDVIRAQLGQIRGSAGGNE